MNSRKKSMMDTTINVVLSQSLVERANAVAVEMNISLDQLFTRAIEDFIQRRDRNREWMEQLCRAEEDDPEEAERQMLAFGMECQRRLLKEEDLFL